jgi:hypothetical protein
LLALGLAAVVAMLFRTSQVQGATTPDTAPETPTGFTAAAAGATLIQLRWNAADRAEGYEVRQVAAKTGATLKVNKVTDGSTAFADQVKEPLTRRCYTVVAVRGAGRSRPSGKKCARTLDGTLPAPTNVKAADAGASGFKVSWTDSLRNDHVVLVDNAPVGQPSPAGVSDTTLPIPAGRHCVSVLAKRGDQASLPSKPPVCVNSAGTGAATTPPTDPAIGGGAGGGGGGQTTAPETGTATTPPTDGVGVTGFVAMFGPYSEQNLAEQFRDRARENGFDARILRLPVEGLPPELRIGLVVVVDRLPDLAAADQICTAVAPNKETPCRSLNSGR